LLLVQPLTVTRTFFNCIIHVEVSDPFEAFVKFINFFSEKHQIFKLSFDAHRCYTEKVILQSWIIFIAILFEARGHYVMNLLNTDAQVLN
jgi:hypothetical protein